MRKLAAIMFTDMVGYSSLSQENEALALDLLEEHRELLRPMFTPFNGTEIKTIGDAFLVEFASAVEAAQCAIAIQEAMKVRSATAEPERQIKLRIGLHVGDVITEKGDVLGDGVNIASRIEPLAEAGGICLTQDMATQVLNKIDLPLEYLSDEKLKGIKQRVTVYRVIMPWEIEAGVIQRGQRAVTRFTRANKGSLTVTAVLLLALVAGWLIRRQVPIFGPGDLPRIAVLPLANLINDPDQEYFVAGMHDALLTELSKIPGLMVISRQSVLRYKDSDKSMQEIAKELNVNAIIEGSVMRTEDQVRINVQLIDALSDEHLWADIFDRELKGVLALHDDVIRAISREVKIKLTPQDETRLASAREVNSEAYEAYLKGMYHVQKFTPEGFKTGLAYLHEAVEIDPAEPLAYAGLALGYSLIGHEADPDAFTKSRAAAEKALELDDSLAEIHESFAELALYQEWDIDGARALFEKVIALNPSLAVAHAHYSWVLLIYDHNEEAYAEMRRAMVLDPLNPLFPAWAGWQYLWSEDPEPALELAQSSLELNKEFPWGLYVLGVAFGLDGKFEEAREAHTRVAEINPALKWPLGMTYAMAGETDNAVALAREIASQPAPMDNWGLAVIYAILGNNDEAISWLEKSYTARFSWMPWLQVPFYFQSLQDDPRFIALRDKVGVPQ